MSPAQEIRAIIKGAGWTGRAAADQLGVHEITVSRWMRAARHDDYDRAHNSMCRVPPLPTIKLARLLAAAA